MVIVCSATAVDWLGDVSSGATVYSQRRPTDDGGGAKGGDGLLPLFPTTEALAKGALAYKQGTPKPPPKP